MDAKRREAMSLIEAEAEAKTKWCPFVRLPHPYEGGGGLSRGFAVGDRETLCIGSACMAWRWGQKRNPDWKSSHGMMAMGWEPHPDEKVPAYIKDPERGYCGLAGRPKCNLHGRQEE
jgi:hypothetical protein